MKLFLQFIKLFKSKGMTAGILTLQGKLKDKGMSFVGLGDYEGYSFGAPRGKFQHNVYQGWYHTAEGWKQGLSTVPSSAMHQSEIIGRIVLKQPSTYGAVSLADQFLNQIYNEQE